MKKTQLTELRGLTKEELQDKLYQLKKELFDLNFQRRVTRVEKPHTFGHHRKMIARIMTLLREKGA
jgi:large subunit ribosomal protein L29